MRLFAEEMEGGKIIICTDKNDNSLALHYHKIAVNPSSEYSYSYLLMFTVEKTTR